MLGAGACADHPRATAAADTRPVVTWIDAAGADASGASVLAAARRAARVAGVELVVRRAADVAGAARALDELLGGAINARRRAIVLRAQEVRLLEPRLRAAHDLGVPVVLVDQPAASNPGLAWAFVPADGEAAVSAAVAGLSLRQATPAGQPSPPADR